MRAGRSRHAAPRGLEVLPRRPVLRCPPLLASADDGNGLFRRKCQTQESLNEAGCSSIRIAVNTEIMLYRINGLRFSEPEGRRG